MFINISNFLIRTFIKITSKQFYSSLICDAINYAKFKNIPKNVHKISNFLNMYFNIKFSKYLIFF